MLSKTSLFARRPSSDTVVGLALALTAFVVYLLTLSRSIGPEDAGELAASAYTLGVSHPTGYPLFHLMGRAFSLLPIGDLRVIVKLNLMGAILCAGAVFVLYRMFLSLLLDAPFRKFPTDARRGAPERRAGTAPVNGEIAAARAMAAVGALTLAFTRTVWANGVVLEVYALHLVFLGLSTWLFIRALAAADGQSTRREERDWRLFAYVLGLSFANHMMTVLLAPAFLWLYFSTHGLRARAWLKIGRAVPPFLLALSAYLYLPLRAATDPASNWGDVTSWARFADHVSGDQYRERMFPSVAVAIRKFIEFFREFPADFGYVPLVFIGIGLFVLLKTRRRLALFSLLVFATGLFYAINYDFEDPNFRLNAHVMAALWAGVGFGAVAARLRTIAPWRDRARLIKAATVVTGSIVIAAPLLANYRSMDESGNYSVEDLVRGALESAEPDAVIVSGVFVEFSFGAWYLQRVEGVRPDVTVADWSLLGLRWHYDQTMRTRPREAARVDSVLSATLEQTPVLYAAPSADPRQDKADPQHLAVVSAFLAAWSGHAPLYVVGVLPEVLTSAFYDVPHGVMRRLHTDIPQPAPVNLMTFRPLPRKDTKHVHNIRVNYAGAYFNQAMYRSVILGDAGGGALLARKALEILPEFTEARTLLNQIEHSPAP